MRWWVEETKPYEKSLVVKINMYVSIKMSYSKIISVITLLKVFNLYQMGL